MTHGVFIEEDDLDFTEDFDDIVDEDLLEEYEELDEDDDDDDEDFY